MSSRNLTILFSFLYLFFIVFKCVLIVRSAIFDCHSSTRLLDSFSIDFISFYETNKKPAAFSSSVFFGFHLCRRGIIFTDVQQIPEHGIQPFEQRLES